MSFVPNKKQKEVFVQIQSFINEMKCIINHPLRLSLEKSEERLTVLNLFIRITWFQKKFEVFYFEIRVCATKKTRC